MNKHTRYWTGICSYDGKHEFRFHSSDFIITADLETQPTANQMRAQLAAAADTIASLRAENAESVRAPGRFPALAAFYRENPPGADAMTIPTEVAAALAEMRELKVPNWPAGRILGDLADRLESALTKAEAVPVAWRLRIGDSDLWGYCSSETDADFHGVASGLKYFKEPLYAHAPPAE